MAEDQKGVTNEMVLRFYSDAPADEESCPITKQYLEKLKKEESLENPSYHKGDYIDLAYSFRFFRWFYGCDAKLEPQRPDWLKEIVPNLEVTDETDFYDVEFQRWHLVVSWYAYTQFQIKKKIGPKGKRLAGKDLLKADTKEDGGILCRTKCPELLLWMYEAAVVKTGAPDLDAARKAIADGTMDGTKVWEAVSGGSAGALRNKIYDIIEKNLSKKGVLWVGKD